MSFNPILIDDDGGHISSRCFAESDHTVGNGRREDFIASGGDASRHSAQRTERAGIVLTKDTPLLAAIRCCEQRYYHDFSWSVPFPRCSASPLLYYPADYTELLTNPGAVEVMHSDLDAMTEGVLKSIPLAYYPMRPGVLREMRDAVSARERHAEELERQAWASGQISLPLWKFDQPNPQLDPQDAEILETDLDRSLTLQRDMPSLTLIQHPLYTDMGIVSSEARHLARRDRIAPAELRDLSQGAALPPLAPGSPQSPSGGNATSPFATESEVAAKGQLWVDKVRSSFRFARTLDQQFDQFIASLAHSKLGLNAKDEQHQQLARALWHALFDGTSRVQQRNAWHTLCHFSSTYGEDRPHAEAVRDLVAAMDRQRLPQFLSLWRPLIRRYVHAVKDYVSSLKGGAAARRQQLGFSGPELDPLNSASFEPELEVGTRLRRHGTELGENNMALPIYPVEVVPVFPSGFTAAAEDGITVEKSLSGELDFLAESADTLHHVMLPGATMGAAHLKGPHVLVSNANLLVADPVQQQEGANPQQAARQVREGATISYHTTRENTFELLYSDDGNTGSYLMRVWEQCGGGAGEEGRPAVPPRPKGASSKDGKYITYDRVGVRDVYIKAPNVEAPTLERYVLVFLNDDDADADAPDALPKPMENPDGEGHDDAYRSVALPSPFLGPHKGKKRLREDDTDADATRPFAQDGRHGLA